MGLVMNISIIDDHKILSELLKLSLSEFDFIKSVNLYSEPEKLFAHLDIFPPDILITDMLMPDITGIDIIKACRKMKSKSNLKIIVLSTVKDVNLIKNSFDEGANAYLCKDASVAELIDAINTISKDENAIYVGESLKNILVEFQLFEKGKVHLSPREKELLSHVCQGETVKEIADKLDLSINTIQSYMKQLMRKMQVNRTPDLILKAIKQGLFFPNQIH